MAAGSEIMNAGTLVWATLPVRSRAPLAFAAHAPLRAFNDAHAFAGATRPPKARSADKDTWRKGRPLHASHRWACRQSIRAARAAAARDSQADGVRGQALHSVLETLYNIVPGSKHKVWASLGIEEVTPLLQPLASRMRMVGLPGAQRHAAPTGSARCHYGSRREGM